MPLLTLSLFSSISVTLHKKSSSCPPAFSKTHPLLPNEVSKLLQAASERQAERLPLRQSICTRAAKATTSSPPTALA